MAASSEQSGPRLLAMSVLVATSRDHRWADNRSLPRTATAVVSRSLHLNQINCGGMIHQSTEYQNMCGSVNTCCKDQVEMLF